MIIVFGGTFNPPTKAHLNIINGLIKLYKPVKFFCIPVGNHYNKPSIVSFEHRIAMLNLLNKESLMPMQILDIEKDPPFLGTYHALATIQDQNPNEEVFFVLGTDHLKTINTWINVKKLLKEFKFIVVRRKNYSLDFSYLKQNHCQYEVFDFDSDIASTKIRNNPVKFQEDVIPAIYQYIQKNKLYGGNDDV